MSHGKACRKIVWSVDPFHEDAKFHRHFLETLRHFANATGAEVEPVYVLSPEQLNLSGEFFTPSMEQYKAAAEKALNQAIKDHGIEKMLKPQVLVQSLPSIGKATHALEQHAHSVGADLIAVATHAKTGLPRFFLGSFAESMVLTSHTPVLTVNPNAIVPRKFHHVLFPTDFSDSSKLAFHDAILLAKSFGGKLTMYNCLPSPIEPVIQSGVFLMGGGWVDFTTFIAQQTAAQKEKAEHWLDVAKRAGVDAEIVIESGKGGIIDALLNYAEKHHVSLIAMAAQSGPVGAVLIGSIARQVVRAAPCPVWVHRRAEPKKH